MPDGHQVSQELRAALDRIGAGGLVLAEKGRAALERLRTNLDTLYEIAVHSDASAPELLEVAAIIRDKERGDAERLQPRIETVGRKLATRPLRDTEAQDSLQEFVDTAIGRLALYRDLYDRLLKLAAERRAASGEILRARPIKGEIDHAALSREFIERFPKIRAALAK